MAVNSIIPKSAKLAVIGGLFKAELNNPTIGKYDFINYKVGGNRFNALVDLGLAMNPNYLYFFHQMNFSLSIDEGTFLNAIEPGTVPELSIKDSSSRKSIFKSPFRLFRYFENSAVDSFHLNSNANARLIADFQCVLTQVADLVGVLNVYAQVSLSVYEITDNSFIEAYKKESQK